MLDSIVETINKSLPAIHKEGYALITIFLLITILLFTFSTPLGFMGLVLTVWCVFFFRDPVRIIPDGNTLILSPADGIVQSISEHQMPSELKCNDKMQRVSIFLNVFNVHVNRIPIIGRVETLHYRTGKFFNASLDKASIDNERQSVLLVIDNDQRIGLVQIAGLIARRIVCNLKEGQKVSSGERFGIIKFGSRVDLYLPLDMKIKVKVGQTMIGGETIISQLTEPQITRTKLTKHKEIASNKVTNKK